MSLKQLLPVTADSRGVDQTFDFADLYHWGFDVDDPLRQKSAQYHIALNLVESINGSLVGGDGTSKPLSSPTDRQALHQIRQCADLLVIGSNTARAENISVSGDLALAVFTRSKVGSGMPTKLASGAIILNEISPETLSELAASGYRNILFEGGATLAKLLIAAVPVDVCFVSIKGNLVTPGLPWVADRDVAATDLSLGKQREQLEQPEQRLGLTVCLYDQEQRMLLTRWDRQADN